MHGAIKVACMEQWERSMHGAKRSMRRAIKEHAWSKKEHAWSKKEHAWSNVLAIEFESIRTIGNIG